MSPPATRTPLGPCITSILQHLLFLICPNTNTLKISLLSYLTPQLYVYILYPMSAVAFCASIYMTLAVTVHCQKYSRTKSNRQSSCIQLTKIVQRLNGTLLYAGPTSTGQLAWPWQTPDACWSTSSQSPPSPSPSTSPSSWRWQWLSTMEQTRLTLPRQERIQPSFSGKAFHDRTCWMLIFKTFLFSR